MKSREIKVLYEDRYFYIVDKPPGVLSVSYSPSEVSLEEILNRELKKRGEHFKVFACHRLDKETSGAIIFAKTKEAQRKIMELFRNRKIKKIYLAFVQGVLAQNRGSIRLTLKGKPAITNFEVVERYSNFTVVKVNPFTGRKNQIRLHFKRIGHPLVGESKFFLRRDALVKYNKRVCLHSQGIEFKHPFTFKKIVIRSALPKDMKKFLDSCF